MSHQDNIVFEHLPHLIDQLQKDRVIAEQVKNAIYLLDLNDSEQGIDPLRKLISNAYDDDIAECKLGIIIRYCGHTSPFIIDITEESDSHQNRRINIYHTDSIAFDFNGGDNLKDLLINMMGSFKNKNIHLYSAEFISVKNNPTKRQREEGTCAVFSLIDTIMMLSVPSICSHMQQSQHYTKYKDNIYSIHTLPPHLALLMQSIEGSESKKRYGLLKYIEDHEELAKMNILGEPILPTLNKLFATVTRAETPLTSMSNGIKSKQLLDSEAKQSDEELNDLHSAHIMVITALMKNIPEEDLDDENIGVTLIAVVDYLREKGRHNVFIASFNEALQGLIKQTSYPDDNKSFDINQILNPDYLHKIAADIFQATPEQLSDSDFDSDSDSDSDYSDSNYSDSNSDSDSDSDFYVLNNPAGSRLFQTLPLTTTITDSNTPDRSAYHS